jgi:hypothetical protein
LLITVANPTERLQPLQSRRFMLDEPGISGQRHEGERKVRLRRVGLTQRPQAFTQLLVHVAVALAALF